MMKRHAVVLCLACWSCATPTDVAISAATPAREAMFERWDPDDAPALLAGDEDIETRFVTLPMSGKVARTPWPGNHWALHNDGINHRWDGADTLSPGEKFAQAMGADDFEDRVSWHLGVDSAFYARTCRTNADCRGEDICGKRRGRDAGYCMGVWWGICDGWSAAAMSTPEPQRAVIHNGIAFKVNDIKALLSIAYHGLRCDLMGMRCSYRHPAQVDATGSPTDIIERSNNAGSFHIALTNFVGLQERSFAIDRDPSYRVFNQPVSRYEVTKSVAINARQANHLLGVVSGFGGGLRGSVYRYHKTATAWQHIETTLYYINDPEHFTDGPLLAHIATYEIPMHLQYILELDAEGSIVGGEWVGQSKIQHPDFSWVVAGHPGAGHPILSTHEWQAIERLSQAASTAY